MLSFPGSVKILLAVEPVDMRKSFNGLYHVATGHLKENPIEGGLFVCKRYKVCLLDVDSIFLLNWFDEEISQTIYGRRTQGVGAAVSSKRLQRFPVL